MAKKGKSVNPADAHRRAQKNKEVKKNKLERRKAREESLLKRDPTKVHSEIVKYTRLDGEGRLDAAGKEKLLKLTAAKQKIEEARKSNNGSLPVAPSVPIKKLKDPTNSLYYDPVLNPFGIPPPGEPYRDKEGNLNVEFEDTEDKVTKENQEFTLSGLSEISSSTESEPDETDQTDGIELPNLPIETDKLPNKPTSLLQENTEDKETNNDDKLPPLPTGDIPEFALSQLPNFGFLPPLPQGLPPRHALIYPKPDHFPTDGAHRTRPPFFPSEFSKPNPQFTPSGAFPPNGFPHLDPNFISPPPPHFPISSHSTIPYSQLHYPYPPPPGNLNFFPPPPPPGGPSGRPPHHFNNFSPPPPGGPPGRPPLHFNNFPPPPHFGNFPPPPPPPGGPPMDFMYRPPPNQEGILPPYFPPPGPPPFMSPNPPQGVPRPPPPQSRKIELNGIRVNLPFLGPHFESPSSMKRPAPTPPASSSSNGSHPNPSSSTPIPGTLKEVNNGSVMISAEPELRDLKKELTTLVPTALLRKKAKESKANPTNKPSHSTSTSGVGKNLVPTTCTPGVSIRLFRPKINAAPDLDDDGPAAPPSRVPTFLPTSTTPPPVPTSTTPQLPSTSSSSLPAPPTAKSTKSTKPTNQASDDYDTFMKEMEGLI